MPHRKAADQQQAALVKARAALAKKHTCEETIQKRVLIMLLCW